jgi:hypothetical protein
MKKIMKSFMAMALGLSLVLSGCSKDDEVIDLTKEITGNYVGAISMIIDEAGNTQTVASNVTIPITKVDDNTIKLSLNTTLPNLPEVGNLTLDVNYQATVTKDGSDYSIKGDNVQVSIPELGNTPLPLKIEGGRITSAGQATIPITITMGVLPITVVYKGQKE